MIQVYTGDGKGKTTAALGLAMRAVGHGLRVMIIQFLKGGGPYGELRTAEYLSPLLTIKEMGRGCFVDRKTPQPEDIKACRHALMLAKEAICSKEFDLVVLDEVNVAIDLGLVSTQDILELLAARPAGVEVVLTGRHAPPELIERADLVTEMREVKHYYRKGILARKGIEY